MSSSDLFISTSPSETRSRCGSGGMGGRRRLRWIGSTYLSSVLMHQFSPRATTAVLITHKALRNTRNKEKSWWQQQKFASFLSFAISSGTSTHTHRHHAHMAALSSIGDRLDRKKKQLVARQPPRQTRAGSVDRPSSHIQNTFFITVRHVCVFSFFFRLFEKF